MDELWNKVKRYKVLVSGLLIAALAAIGGVVYMNNNNTAAVATSTTVAVGRSDIRTTVAATGTISPLNSVEVSSRVTGLITNLMVEENDIVKAGQVLIVLDDSSLRAQVEQYQAQVLNYAAIYERSKKIAEIGGLSAQQLEADRTNYLVSKAAYENYSSQLDYYVIKAPIDGVVIGKPTPAGQTVAQGISSPQVIMTIADMSQMQIKVLVDETDIGKVKVGQQVSFSVDSYMDKTFSGKVTRISRSAITQSNVIYYPVYVDVDAAEGLLYPTMTARVNISISESKNVLVVPLAAVKDASGQKYVEVLGGGHSHQVFVKTGLRDGENIEIIEGLNEGDTVVITTKKKITTKTQNMPPHRI
ncbi:Macrolide export protein MacA [bioreactor metagenome]|uniref:Macrolide export protein MacA n=1 Tax=bioreactor metagenome TaxID=1076179 RepID=A0A644U7V9_9ZZZZ|nr:efflux RND transporter periplasmic adaptor subunit [Negativicutes bacterium]